MRLTAFLPAAVLLAACSSPVPDSGAPLEPIIEDNVYDPSATGVVSPDPVTTGPISSAPISSAPLPSAPLSDKERLVAAIEANGCVLNPENSERILLELGIPQEQFSQIGGELMLEGRVTVVAPTEEAPNPEFRLINGACAT